LHFPANLPQQINGPISPQIAPILERVNDGETLADQPDFEMETDVHDHNEGLLLEEGQLPVEAGDGLSNPVEAVQNGPGELTSGPQVQWKAYKKRKAEQTGDVVDIYQLQPEFSPTNPVGHKLRAGMKRKPKSFFLKFLDKKILAKFVTSTNDYAAATLRPAWKQLTIEELKLFWSIIMFMGVVKLNRREDYWNSTERQPFVYNSMDLTRFNDIIICLHYINPFKYSAEEQAEKKNSDCFWLVAPLVEKLSEKSQKYYKPRQFLDVDEQCIPFKGRHKARQYNPSKPSKFHFKSWCLNDSSNSYQWAHYLYRGAKYSVPMNNVGLSNFPVRYFAQFEQIRHQNYVCVTDNWFGSLDNTIFLRDQCGIHTITTMRRNKLGDAKRNQVPDKKSTARGSTTLHKHIPSGIFHTSWMDSKPVNIFHTMKTKMSKVSRRSKSGRRTKVNCPLVISVYNQVMGGTDAFDQRLQYYWPKIRTSKWTFRVIAHFVYVALVNSFILFKDYFGITSRKDPHYELLGFIKTLYIELAADAVRQTDEEVQNPVKRRKIASASTDASVKIGHHHPLHVGGSIDDNGDKTIRDGRRQCAWCKKGRSTYICYQCNVGLHIGKSMENNCFYHFHVGK
jgi:hypothetical protein